MKRTLTVGGLLALGVLLMAARPTGGTVLLLKLNGEPNWIGSSCPGCDGGVYAVIDAGAGEVVKTQCRTKACICPGQSCVCPSLTNLSNFNNRLAGVVIAADGVHFMVMRDSPAAHAGRISTAAYSTSVGPDGGVGGLCDHWVMR